MKKTIKLADLKKPLVASYADGVLNTDTSLVSATATFVAGDVGKHVQGDGIFPGSTISTVTNGTTVVLSHATTATDTGVAFSIIARETLTIDVPVMTLPKRSVIEQLVIIPITKLSAALSQTVTDGVLNTDTSLTSATATFVAADVGKVVSGTGIVAGTKIASRTSGTVVVLDTATTATATDVSVTIVGRERLTAATARFYAGTTAQASGTLDVLGALTPGTDFTPELESLSASVPLVVRVAVTGANLSALTAGEMEAEVLYNILP